MKKNKRNIKMNIIFLLAAMIVLNSCSSEKKENANSEKQTMDDMPGMNHHSMEEHTAISENKTAEKKQGITINPINKSETVAISVNGFIAYNQNNLSNISARVSGRIEKLYVKSKYQQVNKGQVLFEIYSPELLNEQEQLIYYLNNDASNTSLINASKAKLQLLGLSQLVLDKIISSKKALRTIPVESTTDGFIIDNTEGRAMQSSVVNNSSSSMGSMTSQGAAISNSNAGLTVQQGSYVSKGQTILKVANSTNVWAELKVPVAYQTQFKTNQSVQLKTNQQTIDGKIILIEPTYEDNSPFVSVRVLCNNNNQELKINQWINSTLNIGEVKGLWLPKTAVINLGLQQIVYKQGKEGIKTVKVKTGILTSDLIQVLSGVSETDNIIKDAGYLNDSESFVR
ncbi:MAG: efflux RND transporter periplasmic adaptor subunit [Bacteroidetes bacterium]|nr:efflux RND transporter periplasmic adaptor subunit [Bacteroidota bacterium]